MNPFRIDHLEKAVARGAAFLDTYDPRWWEKIAPADLDLSDDSMCILGQNFGSYATGIRIIGGFDREYSTEAIRWGQKRGFVVDTAALAARMTKETGHSYDENHSEVQLAMNKIYRFLDTLWLAEVQARHDRHRAQLNAELDAIADAIENLKSVEA